MSDEPATEATLASPQEALEEIKTVTVAAAEDAESWETEPALVGLESGTPEVVALAELVNQKVEAALPGQPGWEGAPYNDKPPAPKEPVLSQEEAEALEATHKPVLISSEKIRNKAKSTGYGTKVIGKKPQKPIEAPTFTPNLKVGKVTDKKRAKSAGSQYGKQIPHKKPVKVDEPTFQPELINKGVTAKIRENAKSKIYDQAKKAALRGKEMRAELDASKAEYVSRYTLAADHSAAVATPLETDAKLPPMILDGQAVASSITEQLLFGLVNKLPAAAAPKRSKAGEKLLKRAVSHYSGASYTPPKAPKVVIEPQPQWNSAKKSAPADEELMVPTSAKTKNAVSKYGKDYSPPKSARPQTPKASASPKAFATTVIVDSPLGVTSDELPVPINKKFSKVKSSGYGTVSPVPSVAAKVESYKHRSGAMMLATKATRDAASLAGAAAAAAITDAAADKENPNDVEHGPIVDDLLSRAMLLDNKGPAVARPAVLGDGNSASPGGTPAAEPVELASLEDDDTQLTML